MSIDGTSSAPTMRQALWVHAELNDSQITADDVYDILLNNITTPISLVTEVKSLAVEYSDKLRRFNGK